MSAMDASLFQGQLRRSRRRQQCDALIAERLVKIENSFRFCNSNFAESGVPLYRVRGLLEPRRQPDPTRSARKIVAKGRDGSSRGDAADATPSQRQLSLLQPEGLGHRRGTSVPLASSRVLPYRMAGRLHYYLAAYATARPGPAPAPPAKEGAAFMPPGSIRRVVCHPPRVGSRPPRR